MQSSHEVSKQRIKHLQSVRSVLQKLDVFIYTLGLTEAWIRRKDKVVFPTAPGVIAGTFDANEFKLKNYSFNSILSDFREFIRITRAFRKGRPFKIILTVSPVPLTATATNQHVLVANTYSKATLRAVAAKLSKRSSIDYFPSYEIVTNPQYYQNSYNSNLRTVKEATVTNVMNYFFQNIDNLNLPISRPQRVSMFNAKINSLKCTQICRLTKPYHQPHQNLSTQRLLVIVI